MLYIYNILQLLIFIFLWPIILILIMVKPKWRQKIPRKLGFGLKKNIKQNYGEKKTIWIHALSVGEVTSTLPLLLGILGDLDEVRVVFSTTTKTGHTLAKNILGHYVDHIIAFPLDISPIVNTFIKRVDPDLFILVETDFWPNFLHSLQKRGTPTLLVNGRISNTSMQSYQRFSLFFKPLFQSFSSLCMQTVEDAENMVQLGVDPKKVHALGNLKFDTPLPDTQLHNENDIVLPEYDSIIVAGSTHEGEEEILLEAIIQLKKQYDLFFVIAPRNLQRVEKIEELIFSYGLTSQRRSQPSESVCDILLLDTLGELSSFYINADIAFVGGSLVDQGGHNPIEPAIFSVPVIFGPHMEDFSEIKEGLLKNGGGFMASDPESLLSQFEMLLEDDSYRHRSGKAALHFVKAHQGVIHRHVKLVHELL